MISWEGNSCRLVKQARVVALDLHLFKKYRRHNKARQMSDQCTVVSSYGGGGCHIGPQQDCVKQHAVSGQVALLRTSKVRQLWYNFGRTLGQLWYNFGTTLPWVDWAECLRWIRPPSSGFSLEIPTFAHMAMTIIMAFQQKATHHIL